MSVPVPTSALTAAEKGREQQQEAVAAGDEKIALSRIDSASSRTSSTTTSESRAGQDASGKGGTQKRTWYQKLNLLRLRKIPPVPEERSVSPEYGASVLSIIFFQWMSPLMNVSSEGYSITIPTNALPIDWLPTASTASRHLESKP